MSSSRMRRLRRLLLLSWLAGVSLVTFSVQLFLHYRGQFTGAYDDRLADRGRCRNESLPPSINVHCQMYRDHLITGSLCAPLCDEQSICDLRSVHGNAYKEVLVTECNDLCHRGHGVEAFLKHDEASAAFGDYRAVYTKLNSSSTLITKEILINLLKKHLPNKLIHTYDDSFLDSLWDDKISEVLKESDVQNGSVLALLNTLQLLFRQREYVLFMAFQHSGVFPKVYGTCGPLYLVESCQRLLSDKLTRFSARGLQRKTDKLYLNHIDNTLGTDKYVVHIEDSENQRPVSLRGQPLFPTETGVNSKTDVNSKTWTVFSDRKISVGPVGSEAYGNNGENTGEKKNVPSIPIKLDWREKAALDTEKANARRSESWAERAMAAITILMFLEKLETLFSGTVHVCDPKLEHFAVSRLDGQTKLIDADSVLFESEVGPPGKLWDKDIPCNDHEECGDVWCRSWCNNDTKRCSLERTNNNLQGICEGVFLRPSFGVGTFLKDVPSSARDDLTSTLCACALQPRPMTTLRENLVDVFQRSLQTESSRITPGQTEITYGYC